MSYLQRLATVALTIFLAGVVTFAAGYSWRAVVLAVVLVSALSAVPVIIALDGLRSQYRERRNAAVTER